MVGAYPLSTVSILVVLDWGMRHRRERQRDAEPDSFNPCCLGLGNEAGISIGLCSLMMQFQSLLSWIGE